MDEKRTPRWKPTRSTWIVGAVVLLVLVIGGFSGGFGDVLIMLSFAALATGIYVVLTRRPSWARLPRSRPIGAAIAGGAVVLLIVGSIVTAAAHPASDAVTKAAPTPSLVPASVRPTPTKSASFALDSYTGQVEEDVSDALLSQGIRVTVRTTDGSTPPDDLSGWVIVSENPAPGTAVSEGQRVVLTVEPAATPTPTAAPIPPAAPAPVQPAAPAPRAPAPRAPAPAPAPATGTVVPGGFCSPSDVGHVGVASNGHSYTCGGKGADASGHYHWNT
jgi:hypothetical protein